MLSHQTLSLAIAVALFVLSGLAAFLFMVWIWDRTLNVLFDIGQNRFFGFGQILVLRTFFAVVFALVLLFWARIESLGGWMLCYVALGSLVFPVVLIGRILAGQDIGFIMYSNQMSEPYGPMLITYALNLILAAIHGALGWLFMLRLMPD